MQAASLQQRFFQPRDSVQSSSASSSSSAGNFQARLDSHLTDRPTAKPIDHALRPQDERTIHRHARADESGRQQADDSRAQEASPASRAGRSDNDRQASDQPDAKLAAVKEKSADPKEKKPAAIDESPIDGTPVVAIANPPIDAPLTDAKTEDQPEVSTAIAIGDNSSAPTVQSGVDEAATQVQEIAGKAQSVATPSSKTTDNGKLHDLVSRMDATAQQPDVAVTSENQSESGGEEHEPSGDLLGKEVAKLADAPKASETKEAPSTFDRTLDSLQSSVQQVTKHEATQTVKVEPLPTLTPEQKFAHDNVDQVVTSVRTQSLAGGGTMNVRLDPPELGALQVAVKMVEGRFTATFTTDNEQATQLLSHSLQHLKSSLESSGVTVDRIEVRQAAPSESSQSKSNSDSQQQQQRGFDSQSQQSEQHRKDMVKKMWRRLAFGTDDLDLVA